MAEYIKTLRNLKTDRRGITMLEYAVMGAFIAAALVVIIPTLTSNVNTAFTNIGNTITGASSSGTSNATK